MAELLCANGGLPQPVGKFPHTEERRGLINNLMGPWCWLVYFVVSMEDGVRIAFSHACVATRLLRTTKK